ncbi:MAG: hypothetical protein IPJ13_23290 [Saprospiraceae bacterium]|nr:hypothetical protein [Saprospiraceae bacterium]
MIHCGKLSIDIPDGFDMNIERLANDTLVLEGSLSFTTWSIFGKKEKTLCKNYNQKKLV